MDCSFPVVSGDGGMRWSDSHCMNSNDVQPIGLPPWMGSLSTSSASVSASSSTMSFAHTGQLSPISNGADLPSRAPDNSASLGSPSQSAPSATVAHAGPPPAFPQAWAMAYTGSEQDSEQSAGGDRRGSHSDVSWEQGSDDMLLVPKPEPMDDDDFCMDDLKEAPLTPVATASNLVQVLEQPKPKRPRGRPRKHPLMPNAGTNKITKGRSKTGCLTCRKRKKKCDEAKPRCKSIGRHTAAAHRRMVPLTLSLSGMNCEKNAVVCEGYPEKQIWKSGKERAEEGMTAPPLRSCRACRFEL